jgi:uncharacterized integral membrane protein
MVKRLLTVLVAVPAAIILVALAVANRTPVAVTIDPFNPGSPGLTATLPLFVWFFAAFLFGLILGGAVTWLRQGRYRRIARQRQFEAKLPPERGAGPSTALAKPRPSSSG